MILNVSFIGAVQLGMAKWSINSGNEQELSLWQPDVDTTQQSTAAPQSTNLQICDATNPQGIRKKYFINANQSISRRRLNRKQNIGFNFKSQPNSKSYLMDTFFMDIEISTNILRGEI